MAKLKREVSINMLFHDFISILHSGLLWLIYFWHVILFKILSTHLSNLPFKFIMYVNVSFCFQVIIFSLISCFALKFFMLALKNLKHIIHICLKVHVWQLQHLIPLLPSPLFFLSVYFLSILVTFTYFHWMSDIEFL